MSDREVEELRNRHPVDELADVRAQIKTLQAREAELRAMVLNGECELAGDDYVAVVQTRPRNGIDLLALRRHLGAALKPFMTAREMTQVWIRVRQCGGAVDRRNGQEQALKRIRPVSVNDRPSEIRVASVHISCVANRVK